MNTLYRQSKRWKSIATVLAVVTLAKKETAAIRRKERCMFEFLSLWRKLETLGGTGGIPHRPQGR